MRKSRVIIGTMIGMILLMLLTNILYSYGNMMIDLSTDAAEKRLEIMKYPAGENYSVMSPMRPDEQ